MVHADVNDTFLDKATWRVYANVDYAFRDKATGWVILMWIIYLG